MGSRRGKTSFFENKGLPVPAPFREASREPFWEPFWTPRRLPRGSQERPRSARRAPGTPQEARNEPQEAPNELQEAPNEPQEARKESQETQNEPQETPRSKFDVIFSCFGLLFSRVSKTRETYEAIRVLQGPATVGSYRSAPSSNRPASPRSGRARAEALVRAWLSRFSGGSRHSRLAPLCGHGALLLQILLLSLLSPRLQCWTLSRLSRFPFHDSQVYFRS